MAALPSSVPSAVPAAVASDWLTVDTTAADLGYEPARYGGGEAVKNPVGGPDASSPLTSDPVTAPDVDGESFSNGDNDGAWPHVNSGYDELYQVPAIQRQHGDPQGVVAARSPYPQDVPQPGRWNDELDLQTYDQQSNTYNPQGFVNNVPNNRVSTRRTFGHHNPDNNPTWMGYSENPAQAHLAISAADYASYENPSVGGGRGQFGQGSAPSLWNAQGSSVAYETPQPPTTTTSSSVSQGAADPASGWA